MSMKFVYEKQADHWIDTGTTERVKVEVNNFGATVDDVCESFRDFLKACGYELGPSDQIMVVNIGEDSEDDFEAD